MMGVSDQNLSYLDGGADAIPLRPMNPSQLPQLNTSMLEGSLRLR